MKIKEVPSPRRDSHRSIHSPEYATPLPTQEPLTPLATWIGRIERIRAEEAPPNCPTCGSTVQVTQTRRCAGPCDEVKPITAFPVDRRNALERDYYCRPCRNAVNKRTRTRRVLRALGRAS